MSDCLGSFPCEWTVARMETSECEIFAMGVEGKEDNKSGGE